MENEGAELNDADLDGAEIELNELSDEELDMELE